MLKKEYEEDMQKLLGDEARSLLESRDKTVQRGLRLNTLRMSGSNLLSVLDDAGFKLSEKIPWSEDGYYYDGSVRPGSHPLHEAGFYYIQEPSAMLPAALLDARPGERILDLCAAPGGKSTQIGSSMQGKGLLVCNEIIQSRAKILSENIERMGISNAVVTNENPDSLSRKFPLYFDRIMVDAPCSGEGMLRKSEQAAREWSRENVAMCAQRQRDILNKADLMLRPGGVIVYSTCTFSYEENEGMILSFMAEHPVYRLRPVPLAGGMVCGMNSIGRGTCSPRPRDAKDNPLDIRNAARIFPHLSRGEGHFACILIKGEAKSAAPGPHGSSMAAAFGKDTDKMKSFRKKENARKKGSSKGGRNTSGDPANAGLIALDFFRDILTGKAPVTESEDPCNPSSGGRDIAGRAEHSGPSGLIKRLLDPDVMTKDIFLLGKQLYLLPEEAPSIEGIKILRAGLHLGSIEKDRFEPAMAFARVLSVYDIKNYVNCTSDSSKLSYRELEKYFAGESLTVSAQKGWCLVCANGLGVGWGKVTGNMLKNHYPKGLRKTFRGTFPE